MSQKQESGAEDSSDTQIQEDGQSQSRRKFIKGAATATPIILSVASRPVWARNCSLSGQLSGNLSDQNDPVCAGEGCSTTFWMDSANLNMYHPKFPPTMLFLDAFGRDAFPGKTLLQVIQKDLKNPDIATPFGCTPASTCRDTLLGLGVQAVAAIQNSASPIQYNLDVETVILSFQKSFDAGTVAAWQDTLTAFETFNNQNCPMLSGVL
ncbi:MAG: hypothetical protein PVJ72_10460 [Gammaproteobacteria bacterium]|jgi:hypothetical protein